MYTLISDDDNNENANLQIGEMTLEKAVCFDVNVKTTFHLLSRFSREIILNPTINLIQNFRKFWTLAWVAKVPLVCVGGGDCTTADYGPGSTLQLTDIVIISSNN